MMKFLIIECPDCGFVDNSIYCASTYTNMLYSCSCQNLIDLDQLPEMTLEEAKAKIRKEVEIKKEMKMWMSALRAVASGVTEGIDVCGVAADALAEIKDLQSRIRTITKAAKDVLEKANHRGYWPTNGFLDVSINELEKVLKEKQ